MAAENIKSASITLRDASPPKLADPRLNQAVLKHCRAVCTVTTSTDSGSTYRFFSIPSTAVPVSMRISSPDIGTTLQLDVGLYQTTANGGALLDVDFFGSAVSVSDGALAKVEILREAASLITVAYSEKTIWELIPLTADPQRRYDVVMTSTANTDAGGAILLEFDYTEQ